MTQKRFSVTALQQRQFKAPVEARLPSDTLSDSGEAQYDSLHFIVRFRSVPAGEARANLTRAQELRDASNLEEMLEESQKQTESYVLGIEKHPEHEFPFVDDNGADAQMTPALIRQLLEVREIREAIEKTYADARSGELLTKNSKK